MQNSDFTICALLTVCLALSSCSNSETFIINGTINADSGRVTLTYYPNQNYYPDYLKEVIAEVKHGEFTLRGPLHDPTGFVLLYEDSYHSKQFIVEPGTQKMIVDVTSHEMPFLQNASMQEYRDVYLPNFDIIDKKMEEFDSRLDSLKGIGKDISSEFKLSMDTELKEIYAKSDTILLNYIAKNPDSYYALWHVIRLFNFDGYNPIFASMLSNFSTEIRGLHSTKTLEDNLYQSKRVSIGNPFPELKLFDIDSILIEKYKPQVVKYLLVDFWYSNCHPCIAQFPEFKAIQEEYKDKGFDIIGISSDRAKDYQKWEKAISKYELPWKQYLDMDGKQCRQLFINRFPTNFLLDSKGVIIEKDLRPSELAKFLNEKY
ncbi:MAG: TlpA disulfide reductase family protein [Cyclobacteriaceae bacterium]